jgi:hypothetical protein
VYAGRYLGLILGLKEFKQLLTNVTFLYMQYRPRQLHPSKLDSAATFISVVSSSSETIRCSYQYTVSEMITLKSNMQMSLMVKCIKFLIGVSVAVQNCLIHIHHSAVTASSRGRYTGISLLTATLISFKLEL